MKFIHVRKVSAMMKLVLFCFCFPRAVVFFEVLEYLEIG